MDVSRRNFLRMAGVGGAIIAGSAALAGCTGSSGSGEAETKEGYIAGYEEVNFTKEADYLVIGSGSAGFAAATYAVANGIKPVIVEKLASYGGESAISCGSFMMFGTDYQISKGYGDWATLWEGLYGNSMKNAGTYPDYTEKYYKYGIQLWNYITEKYGIQWAEPEYGILVYPGTGAGDMSALFDPWYTGLVKDGAEFMFSTRASQMITDADGTVVGIRCIDELTGEYVDIKTKAIIFANGGYCSNQEMCAKYLPSFVDVACRTTQSMGEGHAMGLSVGAKLIGMNEPVNFTGDKTQTVVWGTLAPVMAVLPNGKRFIGENNSHYYASTAMEAGFNEWWVIFDDQLINKDTAKLSVSTILGANPERIRTGNTIKELGEAMEVPVENLEASYARFEELAAAGKDEDFGYSAIGSIPGPFTAFRVQPVRYKTVGGFDVTLNGEIKDENDQPIPGLFAAGAISYHSTANIAPCAGTGWIAGEGAVNYLNSLN